MLAKKTGMYYRTSYTEVFPLVTTQSTPAWCPMTVNMFTQITGEVNSAYYKDANAPQFETQLQTEKLFDQKKITGVRMKVIIPPAAGSVYAERNLSTATVTAVNIQPSRVIWAFDPNDQINITDPPQELAAKIGYQAMSVPANGTISRYFRTGAMFKRIGLGQGWTATPNLTYNAQIEPGQGPSVHVRLLTSIQGSIESFPAGTRFG